jgi:hypothetical protein
MRPLPPAEAGLCASAHSEFVIQINFWMLAKPNWIKELRDFEMIRLCAGRATGLSRSILPKTHALTQEGRVKKAKPPKGGDAKPQGYSAIELHRAKPVGLP